MAPKRSRSGALTMPYLVVAPMKVKGLMLRFMLRAFSPLSITHDTKKSSIAG